MQIAINPTVLSDRSRVYDVSIINDDQVITFAAVTHEDAHALARGIRDLIEKHTTMARCALAPSL